MDEPAITYSIIGFFGFVILGSCCYGCCECLRAYKRRQLKNATQVFFINGTSHDRSLGGHAEQEPPQPPQQRVAWGI